MGRLAVMLAAAVGAGTLAAAVAVPTGDFRDVALTSSDVIEGDHDGWHYVYDTAGAELVQSPARTQFAWEIPATFTKGDTTVSGLDFIRDSDGQANSVFIADDGTYYATDHDPVPFPQWTPTIFYSPNGYDDLTGSNAKLGDWVLGSGLSWMVRPADYTDPVAFSDALGGQTVTAQMSSLLDLGTANSDSDVWTATLLSEDDVIGYQGLPMWSGQVAFDPNDGGDPITGTEYMWSPIGAVGSYNQELVTTAGAVYAYTPGFLGFDNLYYDPGNGSPVIDMMHTPLGNVDLSWLSWLFTPPDYSDAVAAAPDDAPFNAVDLIDALDFADSVAPDAGDAAADAASALG